MQLGETDWGQVFGDVLKTAAGAYTVAQQQKAQTDLLKTQMKMQVPNYGLPMPGYNTPIGYSPQYSPAYSSGGTSGGLSITTLALLGLGAAAVFLLFTGDKK